MKQTDLIAKISLLTLASIIITAGCDKSSYLENKFIPLNSAKETEKIVINDKHLEPTENFITTPRYNSRAYSIPGSGGGRRSQQNALTILSLSEFRTFDGSKNHDSNLGMAAVGPESVSKKLNTKNLFDHTNGLILDFPAAQEESSLLRLLPPRYKEDGSTPLDTLPHPRLISNTIFAQESPIPSDKLTQMTFLWGQFLDHDMSLSPQNSEESFLIEPFNDPITINGVKLLRSQILPDSGSSLESPRQQFNTITSFIDGSQVYGSSALRGEWLRDANDGTLKISLGNWLPFGEDNNSSPFMAGLTENPHLGSYANLYTAGDVRANETIFLTALHSLFLREHNRIAKEISSKIVNPERDLVYQATRKVVGALMQSITYNEFLPSLGITLEKYDGYKKETDPRILNIFSTAGFRIGHTMVSDGIALKDKSGEIAMSPLFDSFFQPEHFTEDMFDSLFRGAPSAPAEKIDNKIVNSLRNLLFSVTQGFGLDLAMINIQRSRDHGLPSYLQVRQLFDGESKLSEEAEELLLTLYDSLDDVDLWVGMLMEPTLADKEVGQTISDILSKQFTALRDGDRFYYKNDPDFRIGGSLERLGYGLKYIEKRNLSDIIVDNSNVTSEEIQENVFLLK